MSALTINDRLLHYEVIGKGKPVLFLHNFIGSWRYWMGTMQSLSSKFRCYAFDLWGMGDSDRSPELYSLDQLTNTIDIFLAEMGIPRTAIIGHGFGAILASAYALDNPQHVERMVLIDPHNQAIRQDLDRLSFAKALDLIKKEPDVDVPILTDSLKADPSAFQKYKSFTSAENFSVPSLLIEPRPAKDLPLPSQRLTLELDSPSLFPVLAHALEVERLITEYLLLPADQITRPIQIKKYWKRLVR